MIYRKGSIYEGNWVGGKRNFEGFLLMKNGNTYEGNFKDDFPRYGIEQLKNKKGIVYEIYDGQLKNGKREGFGTLTL